MDDSVKKILLDLDTYKTTVQLSTGQSVTILPLESVSRIITRLLWVLALKEAQEARKG